MCTLSTSTNINDQSFFVDLLGLMALEGFSPRNVLVRWTSLLTTANRHYRGQRTRTSTGTESDSLPVCVDAASEPATSNSGPANTEKPLASSTQVPEGELNVPTELASGPQSPTNDQGEPQSESESDRQSQQAQEPAVKAPAKKQKESTLLCRQTQAQVTARPTLMMVRMPRPATPLQTASDSEDSTPLHIDF